MRISRFFTEQDLQAGHACSLDPAASHYIARVLKLRPGDPLVLFNGDGADYAGVLSQSGRAECRVEIRSRLPAAPESPLQVTLVQGISRGERMDLTLQKATELGVAAIQPLVTERVEVRLLGERLDKRMAHWLSVIRSACEQCGRARVPALFAPVEWPDWAARPAMHPRFVLDPEGDRAISGLVLQPGVIEVAVGPEGGFSAAELAQLGTVERVRIGPRVLRTETAGPAALAILQALAGDL